VSWVVGGVAVPFAAITADMLRSSRSRAWVWRDWRGLCRVKPACVSGFKSKPNHKQQIRSVNALACDPEYTSWLGGVNRKIGVVVCSSVRQKAVAVGECSRSIKSPAAIPTSF